jgi:ubiquinone/menaquinone biosynthesis C-methylase UbiE
MTKPEHATESEFLDWNEEMVRRYDIDRYYERSHLLVRWLERQRLSVLREMAAPRHGDRVLEVGCGGGHVLERFAGFACTGIDLSTTMVGRSRRRLGPGVRLLQGSAENLPFKAASFDVVICTEVLEHTRDPRRVIAELLRVASADARVVVSIPNERNIDRAKRIIRATPGINRLLRTLAAEGNEWHLHHFDREYLTAVAAGVADVVRLQGIPLRILPVRYVALLRRSGSLRPKLTETAA